MINPSVEVGHFRWNADRDDLSLSLCRLVPCKPVELLVKAFNRLGLPLLVVGDCPERGLLDALAGPAFILLGRQSQHQVQELVARCLAFLYDGLEDFGIAGSKRCHPEPR